MEAVNPVLNPSDPLLSEERGPLKADCSLSRVLHLSVVSVQQPEQRWNLAWGLLEPRSAPGQRSGQRHAIDRKAPTPFTFSLVLSAHGS